MTYLIVLTVLLSYKFETCGNYQRGCLSNDIEGRIRIPLCATQHHNVGKLRTLGVSVA